MESIRDNKGIERILAFIRFMVRLNEHAEKNTLSASKLVHAEGNSKQARISSVVDHVVENFKSELSVAQAADLASMTQATFSRNFLTVTGHSFIDFVNRVRIGQACGMLYATDDPILKVAQQAGFNNLANFNRQFLKVKGMTPSVYRDTARKVLFPNHEAVS